MARKLFMVMALISLVVLTQAASGWADTYNLTNLGDPFSPVWVEGRDGDHVGSAGSSFYAASTAVVPDQQWNIASLENDATQTVYTDTHDGYVTVKTVYNTLDPNLAPGTPVFTAHLGDGTVITSYDSVISITAKYVKAPDQIYPYYNGQYTIYSEAGQYPTLIMEGSGTSSGTLFTFIATLAELTTDHTHYGYLENFSITSPAATPTPIPGAVWLLGTGLLGLACVGRRRKS